MLKTVRLRLFCSRRQIDPTPDSTLTVSMEVGGCQGSLNEVRFAEHVQCKVSLRFFPRGNLRLDLTSPLGTTSTLLFERPRDVVSSNFDDWPFLSVHYWGEKVDGTWTMTVRNSGNRHVNQPGILKKWQLIFYGTAANPIRLRSPQSQPSPPFAVSQQQQQLLLQPAKLGPNFPFAQLGNGGGGGQPVSNPPSVYQSSIADILSQAGFRSLPDVFAAAGSEIEVSSPKARSSATRSSREIVDEVWRVVNSANRNTIDEVQSLKLTQNECDSIYKIRLVYPLTCLSDLVRQNVARRNNFWLFEWCYVNRSIVKLTN